MSRLSLISDEFLALLDEEEGESFDVDAEVEDFLKNKVMVSIKKIIGDTFMIWKRINLPERIRDQRKEDIARLFVEVASGILELDVDGEQKVLQYIETKFREICAMMSGLKLPVMEMPHGLSHLGVCKVLRDKHTQLSITRDERMGRLEVLQAEKDSYQRMMGDEVTQIEFETSIPSEEELVQLDADVAKLRKLYNKRLAAFRAVKSALIDLSTELNKHPETEFERQIFEGPEKDFILSQKNETRVIKLHANTEKHLNENKAKKADMIKSVEKIWEKLDLPDVIKEDIMVKYSSNSDKTLSEFKTEVLEKYQAIRKEKLGEFIEKIETEVGEWWSKCMMTDDEKQSFFIKIAPLESPSEELLDAWETELEDRKKYYADRLSAFNLLDQWKEHWEDFLLLEMAERDPDRYKSRRIPSTQIMEEQRRKKQLETKIRKAEMELSAESDRHVAAGNPFTIFGVLLKDHVMSRRNEYDESKENEKVQKKRDKAIQLNNEVMGIKPAASHNKTTKTTGGSLTQRTPTKRPGASGQTTPSSASKMRKVNQLPSLGKRGAVPVAAGFPMAARNLNMNAAVASGKKAAPDVVAPCGMPRIPLAQASIISVNEEEFKSGLQNVTRRAKVMNSTFVSNAPRK